MVGVANQLNGTLAGGVAIAGGTVQGVLNNPDNTNAASAAEFLVQTGGASAGDTRVLHNINGVTNWAEGIDNSDSDAFVLAASNALGTTNVIHCTTGGAVNFPLNPAFLATMAASQTDVTGDGTAVTAQFTTEVYDVASNYASNTFTAPVTGKYRFSAYILYSQIGAGHTTGSMSIVTTARTYVINAMSPAAIRDANNNIVWGGSVLADMTAGDTATVSTTIGGSTKTVDLGGAAADQFFCGELVC